MGGGIFGLCAAYDAAQRGLSVALIERDDFCHASSAHSFKMVHGGIRYLQHADLPRLRESSAERRAFLRIAPHLVEPLPILIPAYGHGMKGKGVLAAGFALYELLTPDRNRGVRDHRRRIPRPRLLSRAETLRLFPDLPERGLTGAGLFHDAQMYNPPRLALAFGVGAMRHGAIAVNYVEATGFLARDGRVTGVRAVDRMSGDTLDVRAEVTVNATGSWAERLNSSLTGERNRSLTFSRDACFVVGRRLFEHPVALAIPGRTRDPDAIVSRSARHLFIVPWREFTLVGVWHKVHGGSPDLVRLGAEELGGFIDEINWAYPGLGLSPDQVSMVDFGLVLFGENEPDAVHLRYGKRSELVDHARRDGIEGLITLVGVRYTTARAVAESGTNLVFRKLGRDAPPCRTHVTALPGGAIEEIDSLLRSVRREAPPSVAPTVADRIARNYGSEFARVFEAAGADGEGLQPFPGSRVLAAEVTHAVTRELAVRLGDIVFRRTDLATGGHPGTAALHACAERAASLLGWSRERVEREIEEVEARFPPAILASPAAGVGTAARDPAAREAGRTRDVETHA